MTDSNNILITITASNKTAAAFDDVVNGAENVKVAVDKIDGSGPKELDNSLKPIPGALDSVRDAAGPAADAVDRFGKPIRGEGETTESYVKRLKEAIDELNTSATEAVVPLDDVTDSAKSVPAAVDEMVRPLDDVATSFGNFGTSIKDIGQMIPGTLGDITESVGRLTEKAGTVETVFDTVANGAIKVVTALGPVGMASAFTAVGISALYLTGVLGGDNGIVGELDDIREASDEASASINKVAFSMTDAATGFALFNTSTEVESTVNDLTRLYEIAAVFQGGNPLGDFASGAVDGITSYNEAVAESTQLTSDLGITFDVYNGDLNDLETRITEVTSKQDLLNNIMSHTGPGAEAAQIRLAELNAQYASGQITLEEYTWQLQWMNDNLVIHYDTLAGAELAQRQFAESALASAEAVGLLDSALELMNAAGGETEATLAAMNLTGSALDSTFGTIVGTTNQLASSSQTVADWSAGLTDTGESISILGQLYRDGLISLEEYSAGMSAANAIQEDNTVIQQEIQGIQAQHIPLMAELTEQQRQYVEGLGDLSAEQQIAALGFMDSAQSARVMELAQLAAAAASGELGDTGEETANRIIAGAANADPVMKQMLLDMGLISEGAEGEVVVNFPNASSLTESVAGLTESIDALTLALGGVPPSVNTSVNLVDNATGPLALIQQTLANLDGQTSTVYINTVGGGLTLGEGNMHGGIVGYAGGGVVTALAEAGPELVGTSSGWGIVPTPGVYMVERGASVLPAPATRDILDKARGGRGGPTYNGPVYQTITYQESSFARRQHNLASSRR
jgi:archaellum component FlaC